MSQNTNDKAEKPKTLKQVFPITIHLRFLSETAKDRFIGEMYDGGGSGICDIEQIGLKTYIVHTTCQECDGTGDRNGFPDSGKCLVCGATGEIK